MLPRRVLVEYWGWLTIVVVPVLAIVAIYQWVMG
jgi:hypothetical protein